MAANDARQGEYLDVEEVESGRRLPMCLEKGLPCRSPLALRRWFKAMVSENTLHGVSIHRDPKIVQGIPDSGVSPRRILVRHSDGQISNSISHPSPPKAPLGNREAGIRYISNKTQSLIMMFKLLIMQILE